jgi:hypothetical protein
VVASAQGNIEGLSGGWSPPQVGGVEVARERVFVAGPEGSTRVEGGRIVVDNKINSINNDRQEWG